MTGGDVGMQIVDLSPLPNDPPIQKPTYTGINQSHNLWINEEGLCFIEHSYPDNVHIVDLLIPDNPQYINSLAYETKTNSNLNI